MNALNKAIREADVECMALIGLEDGNFEFPSNAVANKRFEELAVGIDFPTEPLAKTGPEVDDLHKRASGATPTPAEQAFTRSLRNFLIAVRKDSETISETAEPLRRFFPNIDQVFSNV